MIRGFKDWTVRALYFFLLDQLTPCFLSFFSLCIRLQVIPVVTRPCCCCVAVGPCCQRCPCRSALSWHTVCGRSCRSWVRGCTDGNSLTILLSKVLSCCSLLLNSKVFNHGFKYLYWEGTLASDAEIRELPAALCNI